MPTTSPLLLELRYGQLRACATRAAQALPDLAGERFPGTRFKCTGQSGLRFLLNPDSATWADHAGVDDLNDPGALEAGERAVVAALTSLEREESWSEELSWTDGASRTAVDAYLSASINYVGAGPDAGLAELGSRHSTHYLHRLYSAEGFAYFALAHHPYGHRVLKELGAPVPEVVDYLSSEDCTFRVAHDWLAEHDLTWLRTGSRTYEVLGALTRMVEEFAEGIRDTVAVHRAADELLDVALAVCRPVRA